MTVRRIKLSRDKLQLFTNLLEEEGVLSPGTQQRIHSRPAGLHALPLSYAQQRFWFLDQLEPGNPTYNIPASVHIRGALHRPLLVHCLNLIIQRHEVLRTTFALEQDVPRQRVAPHFHLEVPFIDLQGLAPQQQEATLQALGQEFARIAFDLSRLPLLRVLLVQLASQVHVLLFAIHHIIMDGWSLHVLLQELATFYAAPGRSPSDLLPPLPLQYADYACWQRESAQQEGQQEHLHYWLQQLQQAPSHLALPATHYLAASNKLNDGDTVLSLLPLPLTQQLQALCQREGVTLFMLLLAGFQVLLYRYSGQKHFLIGTPVAGRTHPELESLLGCFVNTLPLRCEISDSCTLRQLLWKVRQTTLDAYAHQEVPLERIIEHLHPERGQQLTPLFEILFALQNTAPPQLSFAGLELTPLELPTGRARFALTVDISETPQGLQVRWEYDRSRFERSLIEQLARHWQHLLQQLLIDLNQSVARVSLLSPDEQRYLLEDCNAPARVYPDEYMIPQLIEAQVARTPQAIALCFEGCQFSYDALNARANQLARYLRKLGVGPEVRVGICLPRSPDQLLCLLAILKAGGAYVPLDPALPPERLAWQCEDAQIALLLICQQTATVLPVLAIPIVNLDDDRAGIAAQSVENLESIIFPENLAYIVYTSGSTGKPKGVMIPYGTVTNAHHMWEEAHHFRGTITAHLQMAGFAFDLFFADLIRTLCAGKRLVMCSQEDLLSPAKLYQLMREEQVDYAEFVPVLLKQLTDYLTDTGQALDFMKIIVTGSDSWHMKDYQSIRRLCPASTQLLNAYGTTEVTIDCTYFRDTPADSSDEYLVPIGRPLPGIRLYILDHELQPVPVGVQGEIYIGGARVGRGYANRPDLTAERYIPDPFSRTPGQRFYQTGDLACYLPDGNIEFLGRADEQIKLRGFRVELGEIEAVLEQLEAIQTAVVKTHLDQAGEQRLVAYLELKDKNPSPALFYHLRQFLQTNLPGYMLPSAFVVLDSMPLTPSGKIDRRSLPEPDLSASQPGGVFAAPRNPIEDILTGIWANVLDVKNVGIYDNFFELGGHSLLATKVMSRVNQAFGVDIPLLSLFETPTVAGLAEIVQKAMESRQTRQEIPPLTIFPRQALPPVSYAQQRLWFLNQLEPGNPFYNVPAAVRITGKLDIAALEQSLNEIIRRHEVLRTTFPILDGQPKQRIAATLTLTLPVLDLSRIEEQEQEPIALRLVAEEAKQPFDLANGPLIRAQLLYLDDENYIFFLCMHHIVSDGWSMGILIGELSRLYDAFRTGQSSPLPALPVQYADFASWQRQWLQGAVLESQLDYWRKQLSGKLPTLQLPTDYPRPAIPTFRGAELPFDLPEKLVTGLRELSRQKQVTLFMVMFAVLNMLLYHYTGQEDILIGSPIANRTRAETEGVIGFFANMLVLRTNLSGNPTFTELLQQVREITLGAYAHQDVPFEKLVEELQPERDFRTTPLFQVVCSLNDAPTAPFNLPGLTINLLPIGSGTTAFDLILELIDTRQTLTGTLVYSTDLFAQATIIQLLDHLKTALWGVIANPNVRLLDLPLLQASTEEPSHQADALSLDEAEQFDF